MVCCLVAEHIRTGRIKTRIKFFVVDMILQSFTIENILRCTISPTRASGPFISTPNRSGCHSNLQQVQWAHTSFSDDSAIDLRYDSKKSTEVFSNITTSELAPNTPNLNRTTTQCSFTITCLHQTREHVKMRVQLSLPRQPVNNGCAKTALCIL